MKYSKIGIIASKESKAIAKKDELVKQHGFTDCQNKKTPEVDLIIALGGDGLMLHSLHEYRDLQVPIYGINYGSVGFLMNSLSEDLIDSIKSAKLEILHPLKMIAIDSNGVKHEHQAINEVSLLRQSNQAAKIKIEINGKVRIQTLVCDGILVATPAGSTAYNSSVNGPIIPLKADILTLTPISPFRPKNWRGALLPDKTKIKFEILRSSNRPVSATADYFEVRNVASVEIQVDKTREFKILFDPNHSLEERIICEQFL
jgi:NAD+ kinase